MAQSAGILLSGCAVSWSRSLLRQRRGKSPSSAHFPVSAWLSGTPSPQVCQGGHHSCCIWMSLRGPGHELSPKAHC